MVVPAPLAEVPVASSPARPWVVDSGLLSSFLAQNTVSPASEVATPALPARPVSSVVTTTMATTPTLDKLESGPIIAVTPSFLVAQNDVLSSSGVATPALPTRSVPGVVTAMVATTPKLESIELSDPVLAGTVTEPVTEGSPLTDAAATPLLPSPAPVAPPLSAEDRQRAALGATLSARLAATSFSPLRPKLPPSHIVQSTLPSPSPISNISRVLKLAGMDSPDARRWTLGASTAPPLSYEEVAQHTQLEFLELKKNGVTCVRTKPTG